MSSLDVALEDYRSALGHVNNAARALEGSAHSAVDATGHSGPLSPSSLIATTNDLYALINKAIGLLLSAQRSRT